MFLLTCDNKTLHDKTEGCSGLHPSVLNFLQAYVFLSTWKLKFIHCAFSAIASQIVWPTQTVARDIQECSNVSNHRVSFTSFPDISIWQNWDLRVNWNYCPWRRLSRSYNSVSPWRFHCHCSPTNQVCSFATHWPCLSPVRWLIMDLEKNIQLGIQSSWVKWNLFVWH